MASLSRSVVLFGRTSTRFNAVRKSLLRGGSEEGPGMNMPFQTKNKTRLLLVMCTYLGTCFSLPFIAVRFQMAKAGSG
ncbi:cytochrome c oxidase subunit 7C, mitochondrial-like [Actinia tenebrosa]|uniref:Cytochrome c oxidase subunit 7C, mitochondrial n=1 Tax=Actinia tenebrosa TaxID=6105 RepID=A0A6P8J823_ACTTE|nr:cytochrome c oxidase subunit 7C, mitochondrial-like [Actinia tenebrosa]